MTAIWTSERARAWNSAQPWRCGFNYLPPSAVNSTEMWQRSTFDGATIARELRWARDIGFNCCRVFLQYLAWENEGDQFLNRVERFLEIADENGLAVMPILFDDCAFSGQEPYLGPQNAPTVGVHNGGWTASPGFARADDRACWPQLENYVAAIVRRFGDDARVWAWDVYNEPGNSERGARSLPLLEASFRWTRAQSPMQPVTSGLWLSDSDEINGFLVENCDIISFHDYGNLAQTAAWIEQLAVHGRPILCSEWMARTLGSRFDSHLPFFKIGNIGCFFWGLVNGRTHTHWPWGSHENAAPPDVWFHDLLRPDGTPYDAGEVEFLRAQLA